MLKISKPKGDFFSLKKSSIYYDYAEKHGDMLKQTLVGREVINFSLISPPDKKRNTVNSVLDGSERCKTQ